jgi:ATP adenylyltransferase
MQYVGGAKRSGCVFCDALAANNDPEQLILLRGAYAFVILNLYPYNSGHAMVVPYAHLPQLDDLDAATRAELMELATDFSTVARRVLGCAGFNLGLNLGDVAGAGVAEHLHLHVVPRWLGDANFMPLLAGTTVMPELLPVTYARLRAELERQAIERRPGGAALVGALTLLPDGQVALQRDAAGAVAIPIVPAPPHETVSEAALRAAGAAADPTAAIVGWAGSRAVSESTAAPRIVIILVAQARDVSGADRLLVPLDRVLDALTSDTDRALAQAALPTLRRLSEQRL